MKGPRPAGVLGDSSESQVVNKLLLEDLEQRSEQVYNEMLR